MEGPGLSQLLGEVVLEHEGLDGQRGWPLFLAVAKDWSALSATPISSSSCIPLGMAVGWAPRESSPWIHQLSQGALPRSSKASRRHLTGVGSLTDLGGPGWTWLWAK